MREQTIVLAPKRELSYFKQSKFSSAAFCFQASLLAEIPKPFFNGPSNLLGHYYFFIIE